MNKLNLLVGISGSGKSYYARDFFEQDPDNRVVISRDKIRNLLFSYNDSNVFEYYNRPDLRKREKLVSEVQTRMIVDFLNMGKTILVDNTHLKLSYIENYRYFGVPVTLYVIPANLELSIKRDNERERKVGKEVIEKQYKQYLTIVNQLGVYDKILSRKDDRPIKIKYDFKNKLKKRAKFSNKKENAVIFDIDGTLAYKFKYRNIYDYNLLYKDSIDKNVYEILIALYKEDYSIIICSDREDSSKKFTEKWLEDNNVPYDKLYMRKSGDYRPDYIVKEEMWNNVEKEYNIVMMFDDRRQVIDYARAKGHKVFDVANTTF